MNIQLTPELIEALRVYARDNGISLDQAITEILSYFLKDK